MDRDRVMFRRLEFRGPIDELARNNPVVSRVIDAYASGAIITKEEALSQMVVLLAKDWTEQATRLYEMAMVMPMHVPLEPRLDPR